MQELLELGSHHEACADIRAAWYHVRTAHNCAGAVHNQVFVPLPFSLYPFAHTVSSSFFPFPSFSACVQAQAEFLSSAADSAGWLFVLMQGRGHLACARTRVHLHPPCVVWIPRSCFPWDIPWVMRVEPNNVCLMSVCYHIADSRFHESSCPWEL